MINQELANQRLNNEIHKQDAFGVRFELACGADANFPDPAGQTALHHAAVDGCPTITRTLIQAGAELDRADADGNTPLHLAVLAGQHATVDVLVQAGADIHLPNRAGQRPVDVGDFQTRHHLVPAVLMDSAPAA